MTTDIAGSSHQGPEDRLSARAHAVWAKSVFDPELQTVTRWLSLPQHLADSAGICAKLWDEWLSDSVRIQIAQLFGGDLGPARSLAIWLTALHDVGKVSSAFSVQVPLLAEKMREAGYLSDPSLHGSPERRKARHEVVSFIALRDWLLKNDFPPKRAMGLASVLAAHHGKPANPETILEAQGLTRLVGDGVWSEVREEIIEAQTHEYASSDDFELWKNTDIPQNILMLLSAIVILADWIASGNGFETCNLGDQPAESTDSRVAQAWRDLGLSKGWDLKGIPGTNEELFTQRFELGEDAQLRPVQADTLNLIRQLEAPTLIIVEAEMGVGKTEIALAGAEILASKFGQSGLFVGLPTQATADGMFERGLRWARNLGLDAPNSVYLSHGKSQLNQSFADLPLQTRFGSIGEDENTPHHQPDGESLVAHHWLQDPKRGQFANLTIGTIDQALFSALKSKHVMLRHLALASKVVVFDEIHAHSAYTNEYITRTLHWLGAYRVPVILLSATLPAALRRSFVEAYDTGTQAHSQEDLPPRKRASLRDLQYSNLVGDIGYPAVTIANGGLPATVVTPSATGEQKTISLAELPDDLDTLIETLRQDLRGGGNAVVIRNTVSRALETAQALRVAFKDSDMMQITTAHARFIGVDRAKNDSQLRARYGPKSTSRPSASIVVATQVVEQSLDIDFDLMVSDLAPIDLLLQRAGRLHRHSRRRPEMLESPRFYITGADRSSEIPKPTPASSAIYTDHLLLRTAAVLHGKSSFVLPDEIPQLVQTVYSDRPVGSEDWQQQLAAAKAKFQIAVRESSRAANTFRLKPVTPNTAGSLLGMLEASTDNPDGPASYASVRDGEDTLEVILLQKDADGTIRTPNWLDSNGGRQIPDNDVPDYSLAKTILSCAVRLPGWMCRGTRLDTVIAALEAQFPFPTWHGSRLLQGELVLVLDGIGHATLAGTDLKYTAENGLEVIRYDT